MLDGMTETQTPYSLPDLKTLNTKELFVFLLAVLLGVNEKFRTSINQIIPHHTAQTVAMNNSSEVWAGIQGLLPVIITNHYTQGMPRE